MRRTKAKRIIKHSTPTDSLDDDDPLVKWAIDCVSPDKSEGEWPTKDVKSDILAGNSNAAIPIRAELSPELVKQEKLKKDLRVANSQI